MWVLLIVIIAVVCLVWIVKHEDENNVQGSTPVQSEIDAFKQKCTDAANEVLAETRNKEPSVSEFGCNSGICDHANFAKAKESGYSGDVCYCSYYNQYVKARESCKDYTDEQSSATIRFLMKNNN